MAYKSAKTYEEAKQIGHQAILIAESFQSRFKPMSHERPKALFPVANVPVILYAIQFLALNKVNYIIIATPHISEELREEVGKLREGLFAGRFKNIKIKYEKLKEPYCLANGLREISQRNDLLDDFIVMYSDIVCNADLGPAIKMHYDIKAIEKADK